MLNICRLFPAGGGGRREWRKIKRTEEKEREGKVKRGGEKRQRQQEKVHTHAIVIVLGPWKLCVSDNTLASSKGAREYYS